MQYRSDGLPKSRLLRAAGFAAGVLLLYPIVYVGLEVLFIAALFQFGFAVPSTITVPEAIELEITTIFVGPVAVLSTISVIGASLYGEAWLRTGSWPDLAFRAGGLAIATVAGMTILATLVWGILLGGLRNDSVIVIATGLVAFVAIAWIASKAAIAFRDGYLTSE